MAAKATTSFLLALMAGTMLPLGAAEAADRIRGPFAGATAIGYATATLSSLPLAKAPAAPVYVRSRINPLAREPDQGSRGTRGPVMPARRPEPAPEPEHRANRASPGTILNFEGQGNDTCFCSPPDTVGDAGPNHYVQLVNATGIAIYNKSGALLAGYPKDMSSLFASGNCSVSSNGDPVVLYDSLADRWLLAQFNAGFDGVCVAISRTANPTGGYFGYEFFTPEVPDYLKFGVWPDGYYMSTNESTYAAYAFNRKRMLAGKPSNFIRFDGVSNFMLPSDVDGTTPPPPGSPNYFYTFKDKSFHRVPTHRLEIREFKADFVTPANSTFTLTDSIDIAPFKYTVCGFFNFDCIPQKNTSQKVDPVSEWPMFRFPYRNYGTHESVAGTFTVEGAITDTAAVYWFELRNTGSAWTLHQQGKLDSNDGVSRWIGSIAMDGAGNLALGYSVSSATMFPAIRYAVHRIGDTLGTMQREATLRAGGGSQLFSNRWGDYSAMSIDPEDDATFWYTNEYYPASAGNDWHTRVGTFRLLKTVSLRSAGINDGWIVEHGLFGNPDDSINSTSGILKLGDDSRDRQFRAILDFNTAALPNTAVVTKAVLRLRKSETAAGGDPFITHGDVLIDIKSGVFFTRSRLQGQDFQAAASASRVGALSDSGSDVLLAEIDAGALHHINRTGRTQFRLRFKLDDDDDATADQIGFFSGDSAKVQQSPALVLTYYVP